MLTTTQQTALDAFIATLGTSPAPAPAAARQWALTDDQAATLAKRFGWTVHDIYGNRQANGSAADPYVVASDGTEADAWLYAAAGFDATGLRQLWASDNREAAVALCDRIVPLPAVDADNLLRGAGPLDPNCRAYLIMVNKITGGGLAGSPRLGFGGAMTVAQAVAATFKQSTRKPGDPGASGI
jgi:hypothetical protein